MIKSRTRGHDCLKQQEGGDDFHEVRVCSHTSDEAGDACFQVLFLRFFEYCCSNGKSVDGDNDNQDQQPEIAGH